MSKQPEGSNFSIEAFNSFFKPRQVTHTINYSGGSSKPTTRSGNERNTSRRVGTRKS